MTILTPVIVFNVYNSIFYSFIFHMHVYTMYITFIFHNFAYSGESIFLRVFSIKIRVFCLEEIYFTRINVKGSLYE